MVKREDEVFAPIFAKVSATGGGYRLAKAMMNIVGHPSGPPRLPTEPVSPEHEGELREAMKKIGWV